MAQKSHPVSGGAITRNLKMRLLISTCRKRLKVSGGGFFSSVHTPASRSYALERLDAISSLQKTSNWFYGCALMWLPACWNIRFTDVSVCHASLHTSACAAFLRSATRLHLFSNKLIPRGRSTPLLPRRRVSAPVLQGWIWDSVLTDAPMAQVFLEHPPGVTPSSDDHMVAGEDSSQRKISKFM